MSRRVSGKVTIVTGGASGIGRASAIRSTDRGRSSRRLPDDVANGVLFLASDQTSCMTGTELVIDAGFSA